MDPFETLLDIERNCKAYAISIPRQIVTERDWLGIGFRLANCNFVCPMKSVSEILKSPSLSEVPNSTPWFKGIANLRGKILPITDLEGFVSGSIQGGSPLSRVLVVPYETAFFGFVVSQVLGIEHFFAEEVKPAEGIAEIKDYMPYVQGAFERDQKPWVMINFEKIIQHPDFYHILMSKTEG